MKKLRVLIAEDSLTVRRRLAEVLGADPEIELVGEAEDGRRAIELCRELKPDVITMDMMMPVMTGLAATEYIMAHFPTPILVVSSSVNRGELFKTYDALAAGAVDVIDKMSGGEPEGAWERTLLARVKLVAKIRVITHPRARLAAAVPRPRASAPAPAPARGAGNAPRVLAIGASTGGPAAVVAVLKSLPPGFPPPILLVLHINEPFGAAFADWLDGQTARRVSTAQDGQSVAAAAGQVVMAPPGSHLVVRGGTMRLTQERERHSCRPSIDVLFESIALDYGSAAAACLLTGMGRDGAAGLLAIRKAGGFTIAQDEATSVIYGMPREAVALGAADRVLPLGEIGPAFAAAASAGGPT